MKLLKPFVIVVLIISFAVLGYSVYKQKVFNRSQQGTIPTPPPNVLLQTSNGNCSNFTQIQGEIDCQKAVDITLEEYPGEVFAIARFDGAQTKSGPKNIWRIGITPKTSSNIVKVGIDRTYGTILFADNTVQ